MHQVYTINIGTKCCTPTWRICMLIQYPPFSLTHLQWDQKVTNCGIDLSNLSKSTNRSTSFYTSTFYSNQKQKQNMETTYKTIVKLLLLREYSFRIVNNELNLSSRNQISCEGYFGYIHYWQIGYNGLKKLGLSVQSKTPEIIHAYCMIYVVQWITYRTEAAQVIEGSAVLRLVTWVMFEKIHIKIYSM